MNCPHCNANWDAGDIYEVFLERSRNHDDFYYKKSLATIEAVAKSYGWTKEKPIRFEKLIVVKRDKYPDIWQCPNCKHIFDQDPTIVQEIPRVYLLYTKDNLERSFMPVAAYTNKAMAEKEIEKDNIYKLFWKTIPLYSKEK